jgi:hypothetical protein
MPELPFILEPDEDGEDWHRLLVDGTIAGHPYRFVLDTGGVQTQIEADEHMAALPVVASQTSSGTFAAHTTPVVTITDLTIGPLHAATLDVTMVDPIPGHLRAIIGMDVLQRYRCHFRLADGVVDIDPPLPTPADAADLRRSRRGHPYVDVRWPGGIVAHACWDTGSAPTIVNRDFWLAHPELFEEVGTEVTGTDATGAQAETAVLMMAAPEIGQRKFSEHTVVTVDLTEANSTTDLPMDMIIGYPTIRQANWLFDFPAGKWQLTTP